MNKKFKWAAALIFPFVVACQDDFGKGNGDVLGEGEDVEFVVAPMQSRTMYADDQWDATTNQELYWGNYISTEDDNIKIFCRQAARQIATYKVNLKEVGDGQQGSSVAESISKTGLAGVQWGAEGTAHNFYAFYPAEFAGDAFIGTGDNMINAKVDPGQSAKAFRAVVKDGTVYDDAFSLTEVQQNNAPDVEKQTVIYAQPDMANAVMVAKTHVDAAGYGKPVPLHFNVLADVLDIQVNGPIVPNQLAGNASGESRQFITIRDVNIYSKDGTPIAGNFNLNMETGEASSISNGTDRILIQLAQTGQDGITDQPVLHARLKLDKIPDNYTPDLKTLDQLRVRAFLIPGAVKDLGDLKVVVSTDCGDYTQELKADGIGVTGQIHRIKLGYFHERGKQFDFTKWMSQLNDNIYVTELSLPGTWHSTDANYQGTGNTTLATQFSKGIRAFETHAYVDKPTIEGTVNSNATWTSSAPGEPVLGTINRTGSGNSGECSRTYTVTRKQTSDNYFTVTAVNYPVTNSAGLQMFDGITALSKELDNSAEFAVLEIGSPRDENFTVPTVGATRGATREQTYQTTQTGTWTRSGWYSYSYTWNDVNITEEQWATASASDPVGNDSYSNTVTNHKFVLGLNWLIQKLVSSGANIYTGKITPSTTIGDVRGKFILKINTNGDKVNENGWMVNAPAIFSRWTSNAGDSIGVTALKWGGPIEPTASSDLHWVYSELDNLKGYGYTVESRKKAVDVYESASIEVYNKNELGYWFMMSVGGYLNGGDNATAANCQALAKQINPYLLTVLTKPTRTAAPMGLLYFNCALMDNSTYYGESLIRTIINNNAALTLRRREPGKVSDNTNSHFSNQKRNPLKP